MCVYICVCVCVCSSVNTDGMSSTALVPGDMGPGGSVADGLYGPRVVGCWWWGGE